MLSEHLIGCVGMRKDANAEIAQIEAGLKSRTQAIAERGFDAEQVDREIATEHARERALGLDFRRPGSPAQGSPAQGAADVPVEGGDRDRTPSDDDDDTAEILARPWARRVAGLALAGLTITLFLLNLRRTGERAGRAAERLENLERNDAIHRQMLDAAANRPRDRDALVERLRGGRF